MLVGSVEVWPVWFFWPIMETFWLAVAVESWCWWSRWRSRNKHQVDKKEKNPISSSFWRSSHISNTGSRPNFSWFPGEEAGISRRMCDLSAFDPFQNRGSCSNLQLSNLQSKPSNLQQKWGSHMSFIIYKVCISIKNCTRSYWNILSEVSVSQQCPPSCVQWEAMMGSSCGLTRVNYCCMSPVRLLVFLLHLSDSLMMADIWCLDGQTIVSDSTHQKLVNIRQFS